MKENIFLFFQDDTKQTQFIALSIVYFISVLMVSRYRDIIENNQNRMSRHSSSSTRNGKKDNFEIFSIDFSFLLEDSTSHIESTTNGSAENRNKVGHQSAFEHKSDLWSCRFLQEIVHSDSTNGDKSAEQSDENHSETNGNDETHSTTTELGKLSNRSILRESSSFFYLPIVSEYFQDSGRRSFDSRAKSVDRIEVTRLS